MKKNPKNKHVVVIPCFNRPEMLWWNIDCIKKAEMADQMYYVFKPDTLFDQKILEIIKDFPFEHEVLTMPNTAISNLRNLGRQSYNVLTGYQYAASITDQMVFLIEEDIMIGKDFFKWHLEVHRDSPDIFCSIAVLNHNRQNIGAEAMGEAFGVEDYYLTTKDFCSWGVAIHSQDIKQFIDRNCTHEYFMEPMKYIARKLPCDFVGPTFVEQDGLIRRIQGLSCRPYQSEERKGLTYYEDMAIAYPFKARAFHAGLYGKGRMKPPAFSRSGSLQAAIDYVGSIIFSEAAMKAHIENPDFFEDSKPQPLVLPDWKKPITRIFIDLSLFPLKQ